mmetsp:Transcript_50624/g.82149  ORF Transcript_50624/g.82149 Transcript_50624/m.82149 type:complete len:89 (-) Transcript_50624:279-545(-)
MDCEGHVLSNSSTVGPQVRRGGILLAKRRPQMNLVAVTHRRHSGSYTKLCQLDRRQMWAQFLTLFITTAFRSITEHCEERLRRQISVI